MGEGKKGRGKRSPPSPWGMKGVSPGAPAVRRGGRGPRAGVVRAAHRCFGGGQLEDPHWVLGEAPGLSGVGRGWELWDHHGRSSPEGRARGRRRGAGKVAWLKAFAERGGQAGRSGADARRGAFPEVRPRTGHRFSEEENVALEEDKEGHLCSQMQRQENR